MREKILCLLPVTEQEAASLTAAAPVGSQVCFQESASSEDLADVTILLGSVPPERLRKAPALRWIQIQSAGTEGYCEPGILPSGVVLTNSSGGYGPGIAEHMLAMLLALGKRLPAYWDQQHQGLWKSCGQVTGIEGSVCLSVGMGDIGGNFIRRMKALGAVTLGVRRTPGPCPDWLDELVPLESLDQVLPRADVVALSLPGTSGTRGMFDRRRLSLMKRGSILLNVGRGTAVDTEALTDLLKSGHLAGAGLDVTDPEPLPPEHPLWHTPGALITPHCSGYYHWEGTRRRIVALAVENLRRWSAGQPLENQVDPETGYRRTKR